MMHGRMPLQFEMRARNSNRRKDFAENLGQAGTLVMPWKGGNFLGKRAVGVVMVTVVDGARVRIELCTMMMMTTFQGKPVRNVGSCEYLNRRREADAMERRSNMGG